MTTPQTSVPQLKLPAIAEADPYRLPFTKVTQPVFARHNTFAPRFGWLKKGFDAAVDDGSAFARPDAPVTLGVGKNMVRAMRYWCLAMRVLKEAPEVGGVEPTEFGLALLGQEGMDPFIEDLGTLWLLHWRLVGNANLATAWWLTFFHSSRVEFTVDELASAFVDFLNRHFPGSRYAESSLQKDASCMVRMYGELPKGALTEDSIHCPFAELGLIRPTGRRTYGFQVGPKPGLAGEIVAAAACEYAAATAPAARTVALSSVLRGTGSPGLAFRVGESSLYAALEEAIADEPALTLNEAGGLVQLAFGEDPLQIADRLIERHYARAFAGKL